MSTISGFPSPVGHAVIPGGAAGAHDVPGEISANDTLISVVQVTAANVATDRTAEFSIPAGTQGRISNTTTNTTDDFLFVTWVKGE